PGACATRARRQRWDQGDMSQEMLAVISILETKFEKSSASAFAAAKRTQQTQSLACGSVAWPGSNGPSAWLSMPAIVSLQADRALCLDDLLEGHKRQLIAALACRVAGGDEHDVQPVDPMPADPRVGSRAATQPVGPVQGEGGQASLRVE